MKESENLMRPVKYAKKIGKSKVWVYKLILEGKVPTKKIGGVTFVIDNN